VLIILLVVLIVYRKYFKKLLKKKEKITGIPTTVLGNAIPLLNQNIKENRVGVIDKNYSKLTCQYI